MDPFRPRPKDKHQQCANICTNSKHAVFTYTNLHPTEHFLQHIDLAVLAVP